MNAGTNDDQTKMPDLQMRTTPALLEVFDHYMPGHTYQESFPSTALSALKSHDLDLSTLLRGSGIMFPAKPAREVNYAHVAHMQRLRQELEERDYQDMVDHKSDSSLASSRDELRALKNQLSTIINVGISIFTAAMAAWFWTPHWRTGNRVLGALTAAIGLGLVESFLYLRYLQKIEQGRQHEAKKKAGSIVISKTKKMS